MILKCGKMADSLMFKLARGLLAPLFYIRYRTDKVVIKNFLFLLYWCLGLKG